MTTKPIKSTAIRNPSSDVDNHTNVLRQLKEVAEIGQRLRGDPLDSFVRLRELVDVGVVRFTGNHIRSAGHNVDGGSP